jgi:hypothetical protein
MGLGRMRVVVRRAGSARTFRGTQSPGAWPRARRRTHLARCARADAVRFGSRCRERWPFGFAFVPPASLPAPATTRFATDAAHARTTEPNPSDLFDAPHRVQLPSLLPAAEKRRQRRRRYKNLANSRQRIADEHIHDAARAVTSERENRARRLLADFAD